MQREQGPARDWLLTAEERAFVTEKATRRRLGFALQPRFTNTWTVPAPRPSNQTPDVAHFAATRSRGLLCVSRTYPYNRRFLQMCGHYLVEPVACTPAPGWEKGQVENQVGLVRAADFLRVFDALAAAAKR